MTLRCGRYNTDLDNKQGPAVYLSPTGRVRKVVSSLMASELPEENGLTWHNSN